MCYIQFKENAYFFLKEKKQFNFVLLFSNGGKVKQKNQIILWIAVGLVAAIAVLLTQDYLGNRITHFILEITGGFLALCTALFAVNCTFERREGLTSYVILGFLTAGLTDILHALFAMGILLIPEAPIERFMPGTWTLGRTLLGAILLWGLLRTSREHGFRPSTLWLSLLTIILIPFTIVLFAFLPLPELILKDLPLIHRPWEFTALVLYLSCILVILKGGERRNSRPLISFLVLGVIAQLTMAFSLELFKESFNVSHMLKDVSYLAAATAFGTLAWKRSRYSIEVSSIRQLVAGSIMFLLLSCSSVIALGLQRESSLMINEHIDGLLINLNAITENRINEIKAMETNRMKQTSFLLMGQLFALIGFLPVLFIIAVAMTSRHLKHILSLTEMAKRIENGKRDERAQVRTEDETGTLAMVFNDMLDSLETSQKKLQEAHDKLELQVAERTDELSSSRQMLQEVLDTIPVRVFWKGLNSEYLGCNRLFARDAGLNHSEEIIGKTDAHLGWASYAKIYQAENRRVMESGTPELNSEVLQTTAGGNTMWVRISKVPLIDRNNNIIGILGAYDDITERKKAQEEQQKLVELIRRSDEFIGMASPEGRMIFVNDAGIKLVGLDNREKALPRTIFEYFLEKDLTFMREVILPTMIEKGLWKGESRFRQFRTGTAIPIELSAFTIVSPSTGDVLALAMVCRDISELKKYQENLGRMVEERTEELRHALRDAELSRDRIDGILKSVADGLIVADRFNRVILMNHSAEDLLGVRSGELFGKPVDFAIHDKTLQEKLEETLSRKETGYHFDFTLPGTDAAYPRYIRGRTSVIFDREGAQTGTVTIIYDVTHEVEINRMKTEFISTAAHELRTPLTSIRGFSEILLTKILSPGENRKFLTYINEQSIKLGNIINELLDISRIESGRGLTLNKAPFYMGDAIKKTVLYFEGITKSHIFDIALSEGPVELYADSDKLEQVLKNILGNAVKYSPKGGHIKIKDEVVNGHYQVTVQDEGIGMTPEQVNKIFDKFYRADISDSAIEGTGLGMTIVKYIIDAHGGDVQVESKYGKGTTVIFKIPLSSHHQNNKLKQAGNFI